MDFKAMIDYLSAKPVIGIISGFTSGAILTVQNFFLDERTLTVVAAIGVWGGALVALLTLLLKCAELYSKTIIWIKLKFKK